MPSILGHVDGVKKSLVHRLEKLYQRRVKGGVLLSRDLAEELCELSLLLKREISVFMDFQGRVELVVVGPLNDLDQLPIALPASTDGLARRYCLHTRLGWQIPALGDQVMVLQFHLPVLGILMAGLSPQHPGGFSRQFGEQPQFCDGFYLLSPASEALPGGETRRSCEVGDLTTVGKAAEESLEKWIEWTEPVFARGPHQLAQSGERALLMGIHTGGAQAESDLQDTLDELSQLAKSAGAVVVDRVTQARKHPDPGTYIGSGKADEFAFLIQQLQIDVVIADDELSPVQQRNLERILRTKVIDRTELILDIFAQRAQSREGKIQVELAQLQYEMPRLKGRGRAFSQQTAVGAKGGIATRGPGETRLETDRRLLRERVTQLEKEAQQVVRHRQFQRQSRKQSHMPLIALVGYTNAGKSTLMRRLTLADVLVEDRLFATLDPTIRKLYLPPDAQDVDTLGQEVLLSDTVGFIRKLPTFLIKAFRATLEEAASADLLWHVWDISHPERLKQMASVQEVLTTLWEELGIEPPPMWTVCNKMDRWQALSVEELAMLEAAAQTPVFPISAKAGDGISELLRATRHFLQGPASYADQRTDFAERLER
ncbi:GTPase HflX [Vampirovibrio chlorellavorus]|uniref:GTPase HflX n=1 Tax=Vampirovibrio chlorellavorus TaxID=758823 RepID=UPI0026EF0911|nr:GTPase HflX [Vampirovibrio chlorellavorus]